MLAKSSPLEQRKKDFPMFYNELMPSLVDFISKIGIAPSHEVLTQTPQYAPFVESALEEIAIVEADDRTWLLVRIGYFIGEYFAQKFGGFWHVNEIFESRYFGRYVVGKFSLGGNSASMIDPFEIAQVFVDSPAPRKLTALLSEVETEIET